MTFSSHDTKQNNEKVSKKQQRKYFMNKRNCKVLNLFRNDFVCCRFSDLLFANLLAEFRKAFIAFAVSSVKG